MDISLCAIAQWKLFVKPVSYARDGGRLSFTHTWHMSLMAIQTGYASHLKTVLLFRTKTNIPHFLGYKLWLKNLYMNVWAEQSGTLFQMCIFHFRCICERVYVAISLKRNASLSYPNFYQNCTSYYSCTYAKRPCIHCSKLSHIHTHILSEWKRALCSVLQERERVRRERKKTNLPKNVGVNYVIQMYNNAVSCG